MKRTATSRLIMREYEDGGRQAEIVFARAGVAAVHGGSREYFAPSLFAKFAGSPVPLYRGHDVSRETLGVGRIFASDNDAAWVGEIHDTQAGNDLRKEFAALDLAGIPMEASIGFSFRLEDVRHGAKLTESEAGIYDYVFDDIAAINELSIVHKGALPGTEVSLSSAVESLELEWQRLIDLFEGDFTEQFSKRALRYLQAHKAREDG